MKWLIQIISIITIMTGTSMAQNLYNFSINDIDGNVINFNEFQGKPILLVNTASRCGFTKQYANLSNLHREYFDKNLIIISTPSNSFKQELSEEEDVKEFCLVNYQTKFILTEIIDVKGDNENGDANALRGLRIATQKKQIARRMRENLSAQSKIVLNLLPRR